LFELLVHESPPFGLPSGHHITWMPTAALRFDAAAGFG
jgi:hypothetical protein